MTGAVHVVVLVCLGYLGPIYASYFGLATLGLIENAVRRRESAAQDYEGLAASRFTIPVSVILAAYNEESAISATVRSLLELDYPEFEVIVVNDGSTDGTLDRLRAAIAQFRKLARVEPQVWRHARNLSICFRRKGDADSAAIWLERSNAIQRAFPDAGAAGSRQ